MNDNNISLAVSQQERVTAVEYDSDGTGAVFFGRDAAGAVFSGKLDFHPFVILTADNSRSEKPAAILKEILRGLNREKPHTVIPDRREAIVYAIEQARAGEILLFAGKGHETYEITAEGKFPFDEAEIARAAWTARQSKR